MTLGARTHMPCSSSIPVGPHRLISHATILGKSLSLISVVSLSPTEGQFEIINLVYYNRDSLHHNHVIGTITLRRSSSYQAVW